MIGHSLEDLTAMVIEEIMADSARHKQRESYRIKPPSDLDTRQPQPRPVRYSR